MPKKPLKAAFTQQARDQLASYGVSEEVAKYAGVFFVSSAKSLNSSHTDTPALVFQYHDLDGALAPLENFHRVRYLYLGFQGTRYGQKRKSLNMPYLPPLPKGVKLTWREIAANPEIELMILEGEGKGLCICTVNGVPAIALGGVDMWRALQSKGVAALPPLEEFVWAGRTVTIVYDSDNPDGLKESVQRAAFAFMNHLLSKGALAFLCVLPPRDDGKKVAADDYVIANGIDKFLEFVESNRMIHASASRLIEVSERYAYCKENDCFVDKLARENLVPIDRERLNRILRLEKIAYPDLVPGNKSSPIPAVKLVPRLLVDGLIAWPGAFQFDRLTYSPGEGRLVEKNGELRCNLWCGWKAEYEGERKRMELPPPPIRDNLLGEYFWLLDNVFGGDPIMRAFIEHWLFYPLKYPGAKLHQYIYVVTDKQGIGKDLIAKLLINFVYGPHGKHLRQTDIDKDNRFNYHEYGVSFLWGDEVVTSGTRRYYESLKSVTTDDSLTVERKGMDPIEFDENHVNRYLTANESSFGTGIERREGYHSPGEESVRDEARLTNIYELFSKYGGAPLLWYARERYNEAGYRPHGDAPITVGKRDARENVGDVLNVWLTELRKSKDLNRAFFTSDELWLLFKQENPNIPEHLYNSAGVPKRLGNLRYSKLFGGNQIYVTSFGKVLRVHVWTYLTAAEMMKDSSKWDIENGLTSSDKALKRVRAPDPESGGNIVPIQSRKRKY